jgi:hypothetical protein
MGWQQPFTTGYQDDGHGSNPGDFNERHESRPIQDAFVILERKERAQRLNRNQGKRQRRPESILKESLDDGLVMNLDGSLRPPLPGEMEEAARRRLGQPDTNEHPTNEQLPMPVMDFSEHRRGERRATANSNDEQLPMPVMDF